MIEKECPHCGDIVKPNHDHTLVHTSCLKVMLFPERYTPMKEKPYKPLRARSYCFYTTGEVMSYIDIEEHKDAVLALKEELGEHADNNTLGEGRKEILKIIDDILGV